MRQLLFIICFFIGQVITNAQSSGYLTCIGVTDSLYSNVLGESRDIYIQIPDNYHDNIIKQYPVAYILDGEVFLPTVNNVLNFYSGGFMPEMVLVGISNANHRTRDLTTSKITTNYGMPYNEENGEAINFLKFIEEELIPYVESQYRVTNYKTLIGHSYGGLFTVYTLLNRPNLFSNYIAIDPSLDWDNQRLLNEAKEKLSSYNYQEKSLFVSLGGQLHMQDPNVTIDNVMQDKSNFTLFARSNLAFSEIVKQNKNNGLYFDWKFYPRDLHGTMALPSIMDGFISVFEWFQMENTYKINSFDTSIEELSNIIKYREEKLKTHFGYSVPPYPEELLNMSGYMNMDMEQMAKAKMYFDFSIKYYPESANAYDSMADYYERIGDNQNAVKFVTKAFEISKNDYYRKRIEELKK
jgi:predicted alpha/beta superfamily hydrolase